MSYLRAGRGGENRRSVFYTGNNLSGGSGGGNAEDWELVDAPAKDFPEHKNPGDAHRSTSTPRCSQSVRLCARSACGQVALNLKQEKDEGDALSGFDDFQCCDLNLPSG